MQINTEMRNHSVPTLLAKTTSLTALNDLIIAFCTECRELAYPAGGYMHWECTLKYNLIISTQIEGAYIVRANNLVLHILPCFILSHEAKGIDKGTVILKLFC